ncbi:hypothetical protein EYC84_011584 [Monilinia fructicola]|uniref:BCS1 N-terminal domain-containing protein n=1 Tax=Monilinia fructicola TaxID=38448 RepID=A0A5M9J9X9_MONFR|nr:hypothetical protein EYC84_011584 [Monilinia fructicola]
MADVSINSRDGIHDEVIEFLAHKYQKKPSRSLQAETARRGYWDLDNEDSITLTQLDGTGTIKWFNFADQDSKTKPQFTPSLGNIHSFWHKGRYFRVKRAEKNGLLVLFVWRPSLRSTSTPHILLWSFHNSHQSIYSGSPKIIPTENHSAKTSIRRPANKERRAWGGRSAWTEVARRPCRPMRTVVLDEKDESDESSSDSDNSSSEDEADTRKSHRKGKGKGQGKEFSLSGLLNIIDGVASHEGRVLVMTTNHPEKLDEALIRPGRVDHQVAFTNATRRQIQEIFERMYCKDPPREKLIAATSPATSPVATLQTPIKEEAIPLLPPSPDPKIQEQEKKSTISPNTTSKNLRIKAAKPLLIHPITIETVTESQSFGRKENPHTSGCRKERRRKKY